MYVNSQNGQVTAATVATPTSYRATLIELLGASPVITGAEYEVAAYNIATCQSVATLQKWYRNCIREIARREEALPVFAPVVYATITQEAEIVKLVSRPEISRAEKTTVLRKLPTLTVATATVEIGNLWAKIMSRAGAEPLPDGWSRYAQSYSSAA